MAKLDIDKTFREASERGDPFAQFELALTLDYGNDGEQNFEKASAWYAKAASQVHDAAEGNLLLQHVLGQANLIQPEVVFARLSKRAESGDREA